MSSNKYAKGAGALYGFRAIATKRPRSKLGGILTSLEEVGSAEV